MNIELSSVDKCEDFAYYNTNSVLTEDDDRYLYIRLLYNYETPIPDLTQRMTQCKTDLSETTNENMKNNTERGIPKKNRLSTIGLDLNKSNENFMNKKSSIDLLIKINILSKNFQLANH